MALTLTGFVYDNAGNAIPGATVQGYVTADDQTSGTTAGDPVLTDANGKWAITTSDVAQIPMDVRITYGSSKRWIKAGDKLNLTDLTVSGKLTVGENDTGYDVQLHGATSGRSALWDESEDALQLNDNTELKFGSLAAGDMVLYHDGSDSYIKNATGALKLATESTGIAVTIGHTTSEVTIGQNLTVTGTLSLASIASNWTNASRTVADMGTVTTIDINGGTIDGVVIGGAATAAITGTAVTGTSLVGGTIAGTTGTFSGVVDITDATEASNATGDTGALRTEGGASIAKKLYVGTDLSVGNDLTVTGDLTISGTTTTVDTANTVVTDNLLELNSGVTSNANDSGIIIERGSTGNNAIFMWDESATGFTVGTTTATAASTGNLANFAAAPFTAAAIVGTTIDAATDFTIGATVITDGVITDASGLSLTAATTVTGALTLGTVAAAGTDTDKFLVLDASGNVDYRTGAEVASDIGVAGTALDDLAAGDAAATLVTTVGNITIDAQATDADVIIKVDDNGSAVTAVTFDGSDSGNAIFVNDVIVNGSVRAATIDYTDGDVAMTIADGGGVTFAQPAALGTPASGVMTHMTGAVTASILDNQVTVAKLADIARGSLIVGNASAASAELTKGTAAQVLTSDGTDIAWADTAGGQTHDFVANGAITAGDPVSLLADGKVSTAVSSTTDSVQFTASNPNYMDSAYDTNLNRVVVVYSDGSNDNYGTAVVGTVAGGAITFGTPVVFESAYTLYSSICFDSATNKVVIAYRDNNNVGYGTAIVGTVSGTSISFGTAAVFESATANYTAIAFDSNTGDVVVAYSDSGNSNYGTAAVGVVSGTDISFGTPVVFESENSGHLAIAFDVNAAKMVITYDDGSADGHAIVGTVSGTDISFGTAVEFETSNTSYTSIIYDPDSLKVVVAYERHEGTTSLVGTISGTDISFGAKTIVNNDTDNYGISLTYDTTLNKVILYYRTGIIDARVNIGTVSGTTISFSAEEIIYLGNSQINLPATYDPDSNRTILVYEPVGNTGVVTLFNAAVVNTTGDWIGIADADIANGATGAVRLLGSVASGQTSLTISSKYYLGRGGTIGATVIAGREVGRAVSATEILITQSSVALG